MRTVTLRNGLKVPEIGLGTWQIREKEILKNIILKAYEAGYRLIDTAAAYNNEIALSRAIRESGIDRAELLLSDKVWNTSRGCEAVQEACKKSLKKLKTDYFDIYLIHWPTSMKLYSNWEEINADTWRGMEELYREGVARAVGVCNFKKHHLEALKKTAEILPFLNQIEYHPGMRQEETVSYCVENNIQIMASSPLGNGKILENEELQKIAVRRKKTVAQVCLRWALQKGVITIPKSSNLGRVAENADIYGFELSAEEMQIIDELPYCGGLGINADEVTAFG